jgi:hypothetical protein
MIWIDGCVVGNCFMRNDGEDYTRSGVIFGAASSDSITIDNCLVFGNDAYHGGSNPIPMSLINNTSNGIIAPAKAPVELDALVQDNCNANGDSMYRNAIRNTIALGTDIMDTNAVRSHRRNDPESYVNNFTDGASGTVVFGGESGEWTYEESQIMPVTLDTLNDYDLGSAWVKTDSYPELAVGHVIDAVDNGDGTHSMSCACGAVTGDAMEHSFVDGECICGAEDAVSINYGDANGDGRINGKDYALVLQYINGSEVTIDIAAADANGDGRVNGKDYALILQFINGWDVTLGK